MESEVLGPEGTTGSNSGSDRYCSSTLVTLMTSPSLGFLVNSNHLGGHCRNTKARSVKHPACRKPHKEIYILIMI